MRVIMIGSDRNIWKEGSPVRERMISSGSIFDELHIVVFSRRKHDLPSFKLAANVWIYPTNSRSKVSCIIDAYRIGFHIIEDCELKIENSRLGFVVTSQDPFETGLAGYFLSRKCKIPLHLQIHTDFLSPYFSRHSFLNLIRKFIARFLITRANNIRVVSRRILDSLHASRFTLHVPISFRKSRILDPLKRIGTSPVVLPVFVDVKKLQNTPAKFDLRSKYPQFKKIILMVGRLETEKDFPFALSVFKKIIEKFPDIGLVIVGKGKEEQKLKRIVARHRLGSNVIFEGWHDELASYYKGADIFLQTSLYEGFGLALFEAAILGCPAVSSDAGIAGELLKEGVCAPRDALCFVNRLSALIASKDLRESSASLARANAERIMPYSKDEYLKMLKMAIQNGRVGAF